MTSVEPGRREAVELAIGFLARTVELTADTVREIDGGLAVATPSLPEVWGLNHVRLLAPVPWRSALELADQHLRHVRYRHLIADDVIARGWADAAREDGFQIEREVVMVIEGRSQADPEGEAPAEPEGAAPAEPEGGASADPPRASGPDVIEPEQAAMLALLKRWHEEEGRTGAELEQLLEAAAREGHARGERRLAIAGPSGELLAMTKLYADGRTAQVEDVYTVPEARGRGFARTLVSRAIALARRGGNEVILITADEDDWPKHLYARLGFRPASVRWAFHRDRT